MNTLLLSLDTWDLVLDASRNIAVAAAPYQLAQDVASAIKTFFAEVYYDDTLGVRYFEQILGKVPPLSFFQEQMIAAALTVPTIVAATCTIQAFENRQVTGQVVFTDNTGAIGTVSI